MRRPSPFVVFAAALGALIAAAGMGLWLGTKPVDLATALTAPESLDAFIVFDLRPRRVVLAVLAGAGLATVGAAYQSLLRNPLAEPFVLGVSGGAAFGASVVIALGLGAATVETAGVAGMGVAGMGAAALLPGAAFLGGILATAVVYGITRTRDGGELGPRTSDGHGATVLLAGVMVNALASASITALKSMVPPSRATQLLRWLTGFIDYPSGLTIAVVATYVGFGLLLLFRDARALNVLVLGADTAETLGVDVARLERRVLVVSSLIVGAIVSATGLIGFVGLIVPHAVRRLIGPDLRVLLPASALVGATSLVLFDLVARVSFRWLLTEPPVGAVTALIGGPAFLVLLRREARRRSEP